MDIRAIVCDVDGTLLTSKQVVDERTVAATKKQEVKVYYLEYVQVEMQIVLEII